MVEVVRPSDWNRNSNFQEALSYDDLLLVPQYSDILSRKEVSLTQDLDEAIKLDLPFLVRWTRSQRTGWL